MIHRKGNEYENYLFLVISFSFIPFGGPGPRNQNSPCITYHWCSRCPPMTHPSSSDKIEELLVRLTTQQLTLSSKIDDFISHITPLFSPASHMPSSLPRPFPVPAQQHRLKLDVPRFDGTDALGWIFKINQYFEYHGTPEYDRLTIASFYMEGRALAWFQ